VDFHVDDDGAALPVSDPVLEAANADGFYPGLVIVRARAGRGEPGWDGAVSCPHCGTARDVRLSDGTVECPACGSAFRVWTPKRSGEVIGWDRAAYAAGKTPRGIEPPGCAPASANAARVYGRKGRQRPERSNQYGSSQQERQKQ